MMITWLVNLRAQVDAIDPRLWFAAVALVVGAIVFAWRKAAPSTWDKLPSRFKVLPTTIIGALLVAGASDKASSIIVDVLLGAFTGLSAAGGHELFVRLISGQGDARTKPESENEDAPEKETKNE